jgi:hypothetical protein
MKQVWRLVLTYHRNWKVPFKELEGEKCGQFMDWLTAKLKKPLADAQLNCTDFRWVSTWKTSAEGAAHGGRASLAYLPRGDLFDPGGDVT